MNDDVLIDKGKAISGKWDISLSGGVVIFIIISSVIFITPPLIVFLHESLGVEFYFLGLEYPDIFIGVVKAAGVRLFGFLCAILFLILLISIYKHVQVKKYKIHAFSGMAGLSLSMLSISLISFFQEPWFVFLFIFSGLLCAYCISVPIYTWLFHRFKENSWEPIYLAVVFGSISTYFLAGCAGVMINEVYTVNAKYFPYTMPVAMFLILTPFIAFSSLLTLFWLLWDDFRTTNFNSYDLYSLNRLMTCYILILISLSFGGNPIKTLELASSAFDFDPVSPCDFKESYDGFIVLDPAHTKVLTYNKGNPSYYAVRECKLK